MSNQPNLGDRADEPPSHGGPAAEPRISHVSILDVQISAIDMRLALDTIEHWIALKEPNYVCISGVHGVMESQRDHVLRDVHNRAGLVTPDGMPLVWLSRWKGQGHVRRVYGPDLMLRLCGRSVARGYRHFLYGGADGVPDLLAQRLKRRYPGIVIAGVYSPPFRPLTAEEDKAVLEMIRRADADIVWVGLSTPKQELWMSDHVQQLGRPVLIGVGAAFDFHAGIKRQAPPWMQRSGLEWMFRLVSEPRRLGGRYLVNNPLFVWNVLLEELGVR